MASGNKRRRELARARYERRLNRWHRRRRRMRVWISAGVAAVVAGAAASTLVLVLTGSPSGQASAAGTANPATSASTSASAAPSPTPDRNCTQRPVVTAAPKVSQSTEPAMTINTASTYTATLVTNCGTITFTMDAAKAPHTVNSFVYLAGRHYFDNTPCHRLAVTDGLNMLQCGDPTGTGHGGPGYTIPDENLPKDQPTDANGDVTYPAGEVVMANTGQPNSGGSQFFITFAPCTLSPTYTPFGTLTGNSLEVVKAIAAAGTDDSEATGIGKPNAAPVLETVTTVAGPSTGSPAPQ